MKIEQCKWCRSDDLQIERDKTFEDCFTNEMITKDVVFCNSCGTLHFSQDGCLNYQIHQERQEVNNIGKWRSNIQ